MTQAHYILTMNGPDTVGIVAAVATFLAARGVFITESSHYPVPDSERFFKRNVFRGADDRFPGIEVLRSQFASVANRFSMQWSIVPADARPRTVIAVSKAGHCLNHLLHLWHTDELPIDLVAV
jgi:formyltetrahydrofolate deformylase